jgi:hypothetical protein
MDLPELLASIREGMTRSYLVDIVSGTKDKIRMILSGRSVSD